MRTKHKSVVIYLWNYLANQLYYDEIYSFIIVDNQVSVSLSLHTNQPVFYEL